MTTTSIHAESKDLAVHCIQLMSDGTLAGFEAVVHPEARNREDVAEPPAARGRGPAAFHASALWLRSAFADLQWEVHDAVADGDLVVLHVTMSGRQVDNFVVYGSDGLPTQVFPSRGKTFAVTQTHWLRIADGKLLEHWANRDDQGLALQLGWVPPSPLFLLKIALATRRTRREAGRA